MTPEELYRKNLALIEEKYPDVAPALRAVTKPLSHVVFENGQPVDIDLGSGRLYGRNAADASAEQVAEFVANPTQIGLMGAEAAHEQSQVSVNMLGFIYASIARHEVGEMPRKPTIIPHYMLVLGLGLGLFLDELIEKVGAVNVIVVEPIHELLYNSLHAIDLAAVLERCERRGVTLHFVVDADPVTILGSLDKIITRYGTVYLDGALIYRHYPSWALNQVYTRFSETLHQYFITRGFYEDEIKMMNNASDNFIRNDVWMIDGIPRPPRKEAAFIVGAGPSLDMAVETIKKWRGRAVVFSCGTTFEALLRHGIKPDFQVELENVPAVIDQMEHILNRFPEQFPNRHFDGVRLIASVTVPPRVLEYFDENFVFFRDSVSSTHALQKHFRKCSAVGPSVSNTAVVMAAVLGFKEMYLFGLDCGFKDPERHHTEDTIYYTTEKYKRGAVESYLTCVGNLGGVVHTDVLYEWTRDIISDVLRIFHVNAFNCGDGALISSAKPKIPEAVNIAADPVDIASLAEDIKSVSTFYAAGEYLDEKDADSLLEQHEKFWTDFEAQLDQAMEEGTFKGFYDKISPFCDEACLDAYYSGIARIPSASLQALPKIAMFFIHRLDGHPAQAAVFSDFKSEYKKSAAFIREDMFKLLDRIRERIYAAKKPVAG